MKIRRKTRRKRTYRKTPSLLRAFCVKYAKLTKKCFQSGPGTVGNELCFSLLFQLRCPESRPGRAKGAPRALQASPGSPKYTEMDQKGTANRVKFRNGLENLRRSLRRCGLCRRLRSGRRVVVVTSSCHRRCLRCLRRNPGAEARWRCWPKALGYITLRILCGYWDMGTGKHKKYHKILEIYTYIHIRYIFAYVFLCLVLPRPP